MRFTQQAHQDLPSAIGAPGSSAIGAPGSSAIGSGRSACAMAACGFALALAAFTCGANSAFALAESLRFAGGIFASEKLSSAHR